MKRNVRIITTITALLAFNILPASAFDPNLIELIAYDLNVKIEPAQGYVSVRAKLIIPSSNPQPASFNFWLHGMSAINKLTINGKIVEFSSVPGGRPPLNPASKKIIVNLPPDVSAEVFRMEVEYEGRLKNLPEFNSVPGQNQWLDDQINSRMVELANYSSWYPQFDIGQAVRAARTNTVDSLRYE